MKKLYGVIGYPVAHSLSPVFQQAALESLGLDAAYVPFEIPPDRLNGALQALEILGVEGFNVTLPHKETISGLIASQDRVSRLVGAVNTVSRRPEGWSGANTDVPGFRTAFRLFVEKKIKKELFHPIVLGAGGSSRSVVFALREEGFRRMTLVNRSPGKARALLDSLFPGPEKEGIFVLSLEEFSEKGTGEGDILINALSREAFPESFHVLEGVDCSGIKGFFDLSYRPDGLPTAFLKAGSDRKIPGEDGLGMLLEQGALSFEIWTGHPAPRAVMAEALHRKLGRSLSFDPDFSGRRGD
ncbi:MAG: shikimate dehydrogenase [Nitrospirae bacterium]|jgi:shikimate dehydrogenase|nr:shikimate dehydrogenase [Nitrospirota bacterium]